MGGQRGETQQAEGAATERRPVRWGVFGGIMAVTLAYVVISDDTDVRWGGFAAMIAFYAFFYWLGATVAGRRSTSLEGMMLAGRSMPLWIGLFTMTATWVGGGYVAGTAEFTFSDGLAWAQAPWGYALSLVVGGIFFAPKMRRCEFTTMIDPIDVRYGRNVAAVMYLPALMGEVFWSGAILTALGTTFGTILGLDFASSIVLSAAIAIAYTVVGGMWSVAITDVAQVGIILLGLFLVLPFAFATVGGVGPTIDAYQQGMGTYASLFPPLSGWDHPDWGAYWWNWWDFALLLVFGGIPWQVYFQRVLSSRDPLTARRLSIAAGGLCIVAAVPAVLIGMIGFSADWAALDAPKPQNPSLVLPYVLRYMTPPVLGALGLGAVAAAVMSSVDSSILSASSLGAWNVYRPLVKRDASDRDMQRVIKRLIVVVGVAATLIALNVKSVYALWYLCSDFVYVLLFPQLVTALFYRHANLYGSVAGLAVSLVLRFGGGDPTLGLPVLLPYPMVEGGAVLFPFRTLAMVCGLLTILIVSYLTRNVREPVPLRALEPDRGEART